MFEPKPVTISTDKITLRPLSIEHLDNFYKAGAFPEVWTWSLPNQCTSITQAETWIAQSLEKVEQGEYVVFSIFDNQSGALVGSTRYCEISSENRTLEIGFTFITPKYQRTYVNTHAKYCLLKHAFEQLDAIRVQFKAHEKNVKSRNAISRLGASFEGILRHQRILPDGSYRNSAIFSVINSEWLAIKNDLAAKM